MRFSGLPVLLAVALVNSVGIAAQTLPAQTHGTLAQQRLCADQADKFFRDLVAPGSLKKPIDPLLASYVDHYDANANICFVAVVRNEPSGKNVVYSITVFDAFEGSSYANYIQTSDRIAGGLPVKPPVRCSVEPRGQDKITCKSEHEFDTLIEKHFGLVAR